MPTDHLPSTPSAPAPGAAQDPITRQIHHPYTPPEGFDAFPPAVHKASTVMFPDVAALRSRALKGKDGYTYGLHGTPTTYPLEPAPYHNLTLPHNEEVEHLGCPAE